MSPTSTPGFLDRPPRRTTVGLPMLLSLTGAVIATIAVLTVRALTGARIAGQAASPLAERGAAEGATTLAAS